MIRGQGVKKYYDYEGRCAITQYTPFYSTSYILYISYNILLQYCSIKKGVLRDYFDGFWTFSTTSSDNTF